MPSGSGSSRTSASTTSPSRHSCVKGKSSKSSAASLSIETQGPGLVKYLRQVYGLTKKRSRGTKAGKRAAAAAELSHTSTSLRPILPRLDSEMPATKFAASTSRADAPSEVSHAPPPPEAAPNVMGNRCQPVAPALPLVATRAISLDDPRHDPTACRWPWLQPAPVAPVEVSALAPGTNAALCRLANMAPLVPPFTPTGEQSAQAEAPFVEQGTLSRPSQDRQATCPPYGVQTCSPTVPLRQPSPPQVPVMTSSRQTQPDVSMKYHATTEALPLTHQSFITAYEVQHAQMYAEQALYTKCPYAVSPEAVSSLPLPADAENVPFVVTPEYEVLANAYTYFEAATHSGAMLASMSSLGLAGYYYTEPQEDYVMYPAGAPIACDMMLYPPALSTPVAHPTEATHYQL